MTSTFTGGLNVFRAATERAALVAVVAPGVGVEGALPGNGRGGVL